jgi:hypothetical protein
VFRSNLAFLIKDCVLNVFSLDTFISFTVVLGVTVAVRTSAMEVDAAQPARVSSTLAVITYFFI